VQGIAVARWTANERQMTSPIRCRIALRPDHWNLKRSTVRGGNPKKRETRRREFSCKNKKERGRSRLKSTSWSVTSNTLGRNGQSTRPSVAGVTK